MSITFHVKGTALDAFRSAGSGAHGKALGTPTVDACALPGAFGGSVINLVGGKGIMYHARRNLPSGAFTALLRFAPTTTGGAAGSFLNINNGFGAWYAGIRATQAAGNASNVLFRNTNADIVYNDTLSSSLGYVADQFMDYWIVWDGTSGAGKVKLYMAQNGNVPTLIGSGTASYANSRDTAVSGSIMLGADPYINGMAALLNEFVLWDEAIDPTTFGARTDFIPDTAFDGSINTGAGAGNILSGASETIEGVTVSGTAIAALKATTKIGVAASDGTGEYYAPERWTAFAPGQVAAGVPGKQNSETNNFTGTLENVTNNIVAATLVASPRSAVLRVEND